MVSGRLREHDREKIAKDLVRWAQRDDAINLNQFCSDNLLPPSKLSQWAKDDDFFRQAYEVAKAFIGSRREIMLSKNLLHVKAYDLNATTYDHFLKEERREQAKYESDLKSKEMQAIPQSCIDKYDAFMSMLEQRQESDLKNNDSNISNET